MPTNQEAFRHPVQRIQEAQISFHTVPLETFNQYFEARTREIQASNPRLSFYEQMNVVAEALPTETPYSRLVDALRLYRNEDPQISSTGATALLYLNLGTFITVVNKFAGYVPAELDELFQIAVTDGLAGLKTSKTEKGIKQLLNRAASNGIQNYFQPSDEAPYEEENPELVVGEEVFKPVYMRDLRRGIIRAMKMKVRRAPIDEPVDNLPRRHRQVMYNLYGLGDNGEHTVAETAEKYGVKRSRITQINKLSLSRLRHPNAARFVIDYVSDPIDLTSSHVPKKEFQPTHEKQEQVDAQEPVQTQQVSPDPFESLGQPIDQFQKEVKAERKLDELGVSISENEQAVREVRLHEEKQKGIKSRLSRAWEAFKGYFKG